MQSLSWNVNPWTCNEQVNETLRMKKLQENFICKAIEIVEQVIQILHVRTYEQYTILRFDGFCMQVCMETSNRNSSFGKTSKF